MPWRRALLDALLVGFTRALVSGVCWWSGFRAVSDDDYSRVVIAARFAAAPSLDPSGTSWLPLPFWLYGATMWLFGDSLPTARVVALLLGVTSAILVWIAARWLGLSGRAALLGALSAVVLPYGAWLSAATVPEAPTAALVLLGVVSLVRPDAKLRTWGGLALGAACLCRYEAWAPAFTFGLLTGWEALRARRRELWPAVLLAALPVGLWLLNGLVRHGDAWFFVARVTQYRAALGHESTSWVTALLQTPWAIVRFEPELVAVAAVALGLCLAGGKSPFAPWAWRPVAALGSLVLLLVLADATGGAATHHPERSLLPVFWFLALLAAGLVSKLAQEPKRAWRLPALALPLALLGSVLLRPALRSTFVSRQEEERVGTLLRGVGAQEVALDMDDFGFFAVQAALGYGKSFPLTDHDPRKARTARASSSLELARELERRGARWLVTTKERAPLATPLGALRATTPRFAVVELNQQGLTAAR